MTNPDCPNDTISIAINNKFRQNTSDSYTLYVNDFVQTSGTEPYHGVFLPGTIIKYNLKLGSPPISNISAKPELATFIKKGNTIKITNEQLNEDNFTFVIDFDEQHLEYFNVCVPENYTLGIHVTGMGQDLQYMVLYDGPLYLRSLYTSTRFPNNDTTYPREYFAASKCLTLGNLQNTTSPTVVLFRIIEIHARNCWTINVFQRPIIGVTKEMEYIASSYNSSAGSCLWSIIGPGGYYYGNTITFLETQSTENITFFAGVDPAYPLFSFNRDTAGDWKNTVLAGPMISFYLPNAYVKMNLTERSGFTLSSSGKKSLLYSMNYVNPYSTYTKNNSLWFNLNIEAELTCKFLELEPGDSLKIGDHE